MVTDDFTDELKYKPRKRIDDIDLKIVARIKGEITLYGHVVICVSVRTRLLIDGKTHLYIPL